MIKKRYICKKEVSSMHSRLKLDVCPFCGLIGSLILHGYLRGYIQNFIGKRGIRIICNKRRNSQKGCGKTFSYLFSFLLTRRNYTANQLFCAVRKIFSPVPIYKAFINSGFTCTLKTIYRLWKRFNSMQSVIRTALFSYSEIPPPTLKTSDSIVQTFSHLKLVFNKSSNPFEAFQRHCNVSCI